MESKEKWTKKILLKDFKSLLETGRANRKNNEYNKRRKYKLLLVYVHADDMCICRDICI